jgi:hypothetical protein
MNYDTEDHTLNAGDSINYGFDGELYLFQKRIKAAEAESKLKQVYIPN